MEGGPGSQQELGAAAPPRPVPAPPLRYWPCRGAPRPTPPRRVPGADPAFCYPPGVALSAPPRHPATLPPCPLCPVIEFPSLVRRLPSLSSRVAWTLALPPTPLHRRPEPQLPKGVLPALRRAHYANLVTTQRTIEQLLSDQW